MLYIVHHAKLDGNLSGVVYEDCCSAHVICSTCSTRWRSLRTWFRVLPRVSEYSCVLEISVCMVPTINIVLHFAFAPCLSHSLHHSHRLVDFALCACTHFPRPRLSTTPRHHPAIGSRVAHGPLFRIAYYSAASGVTYWERWSLATGRTVSLPSDVHCRLFDTRQLTLGLLGPQPPLPVLCSSRRSQCSR